MRTLIILIGSTGLSLASVRASSIFLTTSIPDDTLPKTGWAESVDASAVDMCVGVCVCACVYNYIGTVHADTHICTLVPLTRVQATKRPVPFTVAVVMPSLPAVSRQLGRRQWVHTPLAVHACPGSLAISSLNAPNQSRKELCTVLTKNCDPPELGPALAMLSVPGSFEILCVCSSGIEPVPSRSFWPCPGTSYGVLGFGPPVPHLSRAANQARGDAWPEGIDFKHTRGGADSWH